MMTVAAIALVVVAAAACVAAYSVRRIAWFVGAMESHVVLHTRLMAKNLNIPVRWHDPTIAGWPKTGPHGVVTELTEIKLGMSPKDRRG